MLAFSVASFYGLTSMLLALLNKALLSSYDFSGYFFLLSAQMALSLTLCAVTRDHLGNPFKIPVYDRATHWSALGMGVMYVANVGFGLVGLQLVNVPMFFSIRRLVTPTIILYELLVLGKVQPLGIQGAVALIFVGTLLAGWDTLNADIVGYVITMVNNLCTAAGSSMQKQLYEQSKLSAFGVLYYNALTALPLAVLLSVASGEVAALPNFAHATNVVFWLNFAIACSMGPILTYSSMLSTTYNSPLATSVTGNVKDLATTILGAVLFAGFTATPKSVAGLCLSFFGAGVYSYISLMGFASHTKSQASPKVALIAALLKGGEEKKAEGEDLKLLGGGGGGGGGASDDGQGDSEGSGGVGGAEGESGSGGGGGGGSAAASSSELSGSGSGGSGAAALLRRAPS